MTAHTNHGIIASIAFVLLASAGCSSSDSSGGGSSRRIDGPCGQWTIDGRWSTHQSNGFDDEYEFTQNGTSISGRATQKSGEQAVLEGSLFGDELDLLVYWHGGVIGVYEARVTEGKLIGRTQDARGGPMVSWTGIGPTSCAE